MRGTGGILGLGAVLVLTAWCTPGSLRAQDALSPEERLAAAEAAYDRGARAFRKGEYAAAGRWYERADELEPAVPSLVEAIRSYRRAGLERRAATIAAYLVEREGPEQSKHARFVDGVTNSSFRVEVVCAWCKLEVDGERERYQTLFLTPGDEHRIVARFETGTRETTVQGPAGEQQRVTFEPPEPEVAEPRHSDDASAPEPDEAAEDAATDLDEAEGGGLPPPVLYVAAGATLAVGAVTLWSAVDTRKAKDAFDDDMTLERLQAGNDKETRTNALLGVAAGLAATTVVLAVFTDWSGGDESEAPVDVAVSPDGFAVAAGGRF
ncbi:MAG: hypothetical protein ACOCUS_07285 [Polyangiales bacterium]